MPLPISGNKYAQKVGNAFTLILFLAIAGNLYSCNDKRTERKIAPSFYYWKSVLRLTADEEKRLEELKVRTLYVKFFDVDWDNVGRKPIPVAVLQNPGYNLPNSLMVIPVVFITNECIQQIDSSQTDLLAGKLTGLVKDIYSNNRFANPVTEIQIDCDWTASTKDKYFSLLRAIKHLSQVNISVTIRLHQIKFIAKTGIPPVDKGLLMCYNMGNLKNPATNNSIIEAPELKKYTGNLADYPLLLDVALPLFDWKVLFRDGQYKGLIENLSDSVFTGAYCRKKENRYEILKDTILQGYELKKGDMIRVEESPYNEIIAVLDEIGGQLKNTHPRVVLYHLDTLLLNKYSTHELESIYSRLH